MKPAPDRIRSLPIWYLMSRTFAQPAAFVLTALYIFFEYVRPQGNYPVLNILPWARFTLIGAAVASLLAGRSSLSIRGGWILITAYTGILLASIAAAVYPEAGMAKLNLWLSWLVVIYIVSSACDNEEQFILLIGAFILWNFKMSLGGFKSWASAGFRFRAWGISGPSGWFQNSGEFGIEMCVFLPIVIYFLIGLYPHLARWKKGLLAFAAVTTVVSITGSSSRGALVGGALVAIWMLWNSPSRVKGFIYLGVLTAIMWVFLPEAQKERFRTAGDDGTSQNRITYWKDGIEIANRYPLTGIGYNNWLPYYNTYYPGRGRGQLPHNIFIEAWSELGYPGLITFILLIGYTFWENARTRRITNRDGPSPNRFAYYMSYGFDGALIGYLGSGFFITVLYYPYFWVNLAFTMGLASVARKGTGQKLSRRNPHSMVSRQSPAPQRAWSRPAAASATHG